MLSKVIHSIFIHWFIDRLKQCLDTQSRLALTLDVTLHSTSPFKPLGLQVCVIIQGKENKRNAGNIKRRPSTVAHIYVPTSQEAEAGGLHVRSTWVV